jgi:hypothetical protein
MEIDFSINDKIQLFRSAGLNVERQNMVFAFSENKHEVLTVWTVENPHTGKPELLNEMFDKFVKLKIKKLILSESKLELFKLFSDDNKKR